MATLVRLHEPHPWLNVIEYPFATRHHGTRDGWMSYIDEGAGRPIVFVHGAPLWSFCWRKLVRGLSDRYRCVAPDMLGFGLSDKPETADYSPLAHVRRFGELMDRLELDDVTLVVHDYGAAVGLDWAMQNPNRVRELVIFNSWMWSTREDRVARQLHRLFGSRINRWYYRVLPAGPSFFLPVLFADRHRVPRFTREQYLMPFVRQKERQGPYTAAEDLLKRSDWYEGLWQRVDQLHPFPTLLIWGMEDISLGEDALERWREALPEARTCRLPRAARYAMDDAPVASLEAIRNFLS
ncbi:MAG: alpha/beta fold hydrolase [Fimbriimonas sp.]